MADAIGKIYCSDRDDDSHRISNGEDAERAKEAYTSFLRESRAKSAGGA